MITLSVKKKTLLAKFFKMTKSKFKTIDDLFFHEDDYLQVEIIPKGNFFHKSRNISKSEFELNELGISNASFRESHKIPTQEIGISKDYLVSTLEEYALVKFKNIFSGYGSKTNILRKDIISYGYEDYAILFDYNQNIVQNIWLVFNPKLKHPLYGYVNLTKVLLSLGEKFDLMLVDWNEDVIINLNLEEKIIIYLNSI